MSKDDGKGLGKRCPRMFTDWRPTRLSAMLVSLLATARAAVTGSLRPSLPIYPESAQFRHERFRNKVSREPMTFRQGLAVWRDFLFNKPSGTVPDRAISVQPLTKADLLAIKPATNIPPAIAGKASMKSSKT